MHERKAEEKNRYFEEVTRNLQREGLTVLPEQDGFLPVELDGQPLCCILDSGIVRYWEKDIASDNRREVLEQVTDIAKVTDEYMNQIESAPILKAGSLDENYKLLADFSDTVLAGRLTKYGAQLITWSRGPDGTSLNQGHYFGPDCGLEGYAVAKKDFAVRSGLVNVNQLFTPEQLVEVYRSINETLDSEYPITDTRREILESACTQIERTVPNLEALVQESHQEEQELGATWLEQGY